MKNNKQIFQKTIKKTASLNGVGLHTGENVTITFKPSVSNSGYLFKRVDIKNSPTIEADVPVSYTHLTLPTNREV